MALSLVGSNFRRTQETKGFHCRNGRTVQDRGSCFESGRRHATDDQRWHFTPRTSSLLWRPRPFPARSETGTGSRTNHLQHSSLLPKHDRATHPTQVGDTYVEDVRPALVQDWLRRLEFSPKYKGHIRS